MRYARSSARIRGGTAVAIGNNRKRQGTMREFQAVSGGGDRAVRPFAGADHPERVPGERVGFSVDFRRPRRPDPVSPRLGRTPTVWETEMVALKNLERHTGDPGTVLLPGGTLAGMSVTCRKPAVLHSSGVHGTAAPVFRPSLRSGRERILGIPAVVGFDHRIPPVLAPTSPVPAPQPGRDKPCNPLSHRDIPPAPARRALRAASRPGVHSNVPGTHEPFNRDRSATA